MAKFKKTFLAGLCAVLSIFSVIYASPATQIHGSDLTYLGMFLPPLTGNYMGMPDMFGSTSSMTYRPDGDPSGSSDGYAGSLFLSSHGFVGEIKIPAPVKTTNPGSIPIAQEIQSSGDITSGANLGSTDRFGGVAYMGPKGPQTTAKLYWGVHEYYNVAANDYVSIGMSEITLSAPNAKGAWHVGPAATDLDSPYHGMKSGEYLIPIDQAWADQHTGGKSLLVGRGREAGCCGGSMGPVLLAIAPWLDGNPLANGSDLTTTPLMYFNSVTQHTSDTTWERWRLMNDPDYSYYSPGDLWRGGAWVGRGAKKALIMGCRHGTLDMVKVTCAAVGSDGCHGGVGTNSAPFCYGQGGVECPYTNGIANNNSKGYHCGPGKSRLAFIDPDDLAAVAQGTKKAWDVKAYDTYDPTPDWPQNTTGSRNNIWQGKGGIGGVAYDAANGLLYVAQGDGYCPACVNDVNAGSYPLIHVYKVNGGAVVKALTRKTQTGFSVEIIPSIFNQKTTVILKINGGNTDCFELSLYNLRGRLIKVVRFRSSVPLEGDIFDRLSGMYLAVVKIGPATAYKQIMFMP